MGDHDTSAPRWQMQLGSRAELERYGGGSCGCGQSPQGQCRSSRKRALKAPANCPVLSIRLEFCVPPGGQRGPRTRSRFTITYGCALCGQQTQIEQIHEAAAGLASMCRFAALLRLRPVPAGSKAHSPSGAAAGGADHNTWRALTQALKQSIAAARGQAQAQTAGSPHSREPKRVQPSRRNPHAPPISAADMARGLDRIRGACSWSQLLRAMGIDP